MIVADLRVTVLVGVLNGDVAEVYVQAKIDAEGEIGTAKGVFVVSCEHFIGVSGALHRPVHVFRPVMPGLFCRVGVGRLPKAPAAGGKGHTHHDAHAAVTGFLDGCHRADGPGGGVGHQLRFVVGHHTLVRHDIQRIDDILRRAPGHSAGKHVEGVDRRGDLAQPRPLTEAAAAALVLQSVRSQEVGEVVAQLQGLGRELLIGDDRKAGRGRLIDHIDAGKGIDAGAAVCGQGSHQHVAVRVEGGIIRRKFLDRQRGGIGFRVPRQLRAVVLRIRRIDPMDRAGELVLEVERHVQDMLRHGNGIAGRVRGQVACAGIDGDVDHQLPAVHLHRADRAAVEPVQRNAHALKACAAGRPAFHRNAAQRDGNGLHLGGLPVRIVEDRVLRRRVRRSQPDLPDGDLPVVGNGITHPGAALQTDCGGREAAVRRAGAASHGNSDPRARHRDDIAGIVARGEIQRGGIGRAVKGIQGMLAFGPVHLQGDDVVTRLGAGEEPEDAAGVRPAAGGQRPQRDMRAVPGQRRELDELVGDHGGLDRVVGIAADGLRGAQTRKQALFSVEILQIAVRNPDLNGIFPVAEHLPELIVILRQKIGGRVVLVRVGAPDEIAAVRLLRQRTGSAAPAAEVADADRGQRGRRTLGSVDRVEGQLVAVVEGVGAGSEHPISCRSAAVVLRGLLGLEKGHVVDLDLVPGARSGVFVPDGVQPEPVHPALPGRFGDGLALVGVHRPHILLRNVDQVGVPLGVLLQIDMDAGRAGGTAVVESSEQLDGVRPAQVFGADLGPDELACIAVGHVDGDVGIVSRGGEGIVPAAGCVGFRAPVDAIPGAGAHARVHFPVSVEIPEEQRVVRNADAAVPGVLDLDGDVLHVVEHRLHLDRAGIRAVGGFSPGDVVIVCQLVDQVLAELHVDRAGAAVAQAQGVGGAVVLHRHQLCQPGPFLRSQTRDGKVSVRPVDAGGLQRIVQNGGFILVQDLLLRQPLKGQYVRRLKLDCELPLDGLDRIDRDIRVAVV